MVALATSLEESKRGPDRSYSNKFLSSDAKIAKIGLVDPEIIGLQSKKKEIMDGKIYSPVGKFAERSASLPSGLKKPLFHVKQT